MVGVAEFERLRRLEVVDDPEEEGKEDARSAVARHAVDVDGFAGRIAD